MEALTEFDCLGHISGDWDSGGLRWWFLEALVDLKAGESHMLPELRTPGLDRNEPPPPLPGIAHRRHDMTGRA